MRDLRGLKLKKSHIRHDGYIVSEPCCRATESGGLRGKVLSLFSTILEGERKRICDCGYPTGFLGLLPGNGSSNSWSSRFFLA